MSHIRLVVRPAPQIRTIVRGPGGSSDAALAAAYLMTVDPGVAGVLWNDNGTPRWGTGGSISAYSPSIDFSDARNSQYITLIFEEF